ncbi:MAG: NAD(P)-dependent oxidoreductase [Hyphomicrobiaceae bacterium]
MTSTHTVGWIGMGRMGEPMADKVLKQFKSLSVWNRTKAKADSLAGKGAKIVDRPADLNDVDILFVMVATGADVEHVLFGPGGAATAGKGKSPKIVVDCSSISVEESAGLREKLSATGCDLIACPVSGNGKVVKAGKLSAVASGPKAAFDVAKPYIEAFAPRGVSYVGEGELSRICKIAHNVMLGVVIQNLCEITIMAEKLGVPRHAFLDFMNNSVMGSMFTRYKSNALVNLDWTTTFTHKLLLKDLDLGLAAGHDLDVPMPVTAAARQAIQAHYGTAFLRPEGETYLEKDFAALLETIAMQSGIKLKPENVPVPTGLE